MKKMLLSVVVLLGMIWVSFWTYSNSSHWSTWLNVEKTNLNFHANLQDDWNVHMTWAPFHLPQGHKFLYRKVMRSQTSSDPVYKVDPYIKVSSDLWFTWYTDKDAKEWTNYYRVCAVTQAYDWYHRYCSSNVDKLNINRNTYQNTYQNKPIEEKSVVISTNLSDALKSAVDALITKLLDNLDDKFDDDVNSKIDLLETISKKLSTTQVSYRVKPLITYLTAKLDEAIWLLEVEALLQID